MTSATDHIVEEQEFDVRRQWVVIPSSVDLQSTKVRLTIESVEDEQVTFSSEETELARPTVPIDLVAAQIDTGTIHPR